jgi:Ca-activated chloride channel family protein
MIHYGEPLAFLFFLPLLALVLIWVFKKFISKKKKERFNLPGIQDRGLGAGSSEAILEKALYPLLFLSLGFLIWALARPQDSGTPIRKNKEGVDIVLALDLSRSMDAEDFRPNNRFHVARENLKSFVGRREDDRIGLVVFSGEAVTLCPPTYDKSVLLEQLELAETGMLRDGTAIGDALMQSVNRLRDSKARSRVIVLLTDGDNNYGKIDPLSAAEVAAGYGLKVYTIGIGTRGAVPIPLYQKDPFGNVRKTYIRTRAKLDMNLLRTISEKTGGKTYRVTDPKALERVIREIDELEKSKIETVIHVQHEEYFYPFLVFGGLLFFVIGILKTGPLRKIPS